jgi:ribonucleoside-triphosphate reductase
MSAMGIGIAEIRKRDGRIVAFDRTKIVAAIMKAAQAVQGSDYRLAEELADHVVRRCGKDLGGAEAHPTVEAVQDTIEKVLIEHGHARTAKAFILYRARRSRIREGKSELMDAVGEILQRDGGAGGAGWPAAKHHAIGVAASREYYLNRVLPEPMADAHLRGDWHVHALSHYDQTPHSAVLPYRALLQQGFTSGHGFMRPPRRAATAAALTAVMLQAAQGDVHGGLAIPSFDGDLAAILPPGTDAAELADAMESLVYSLNTLVAPTGGPPPRATLQIGLDATPIGRLVAGALLDAAALGLGRGEAALRPHVVFALREGVNLRPGDPNFDLTRRAAALAGQRPVVSFLADDPGAVALGHAARLARPALDPAGLGLVARVSLNLPRLAMRARRDGFDVAQGVEEAIDLAAAQLQHRLQALGARAASEFPFLMAQGLPAGPALRPTDRIAPALAQGTLAINVVGLAETLMVLSGQHHGDSPSAQAEGLELMRRAAARCAQLSADTGLRFVLQAVEAPAAAARFARLDRREFGIVRGVTDGSGYTVGVLLPPGGADGVGDRLAVEAAYAPLFDGGCVGITHVPGPLAEDEVLAWLHQGVTAGHRLLALAFPVALCPGCGLTVAGAPAPECDRCGSPASMLRPLVRHDGYLRVEA